MLNAVLNICLVYLNFEYKKKMYLLIQTNNPQWLKQQSSTSIQSMMTKHDISKK